MKLKKLMILIFLISILVVSSYAQDSYRWDLITALSRNNYEEVENIIKNNIDSLSGAEKRMIMSFSLTYSRNDTALNTITLLTDYGVPVIAHDLYTALNMNQSDAVIRHLLQNGAAANGEILLLAMSRKRLDFAREFIESGADVNYSYPLSRSYADGMTPLLYASKWNDFDLVSILLDKGANINARSREGETALSIAQSNGYTQIYDYLLEKGASPAMASPQQVSPVPQTPLSGIHSGGMASLLGTQLSGLQRGEYRLSGGDLTIRFTGTETAGSISYTINGRASVPAKAGNGVYIINQTALTVTMEGRTFIYNIDSPTTFSGNGEVWVRVGD